MNKHVSLLIASFIVGLVVFILFYFVFSHSSLESLNYGLCAAVGGLAGEYVRQWQSKKSGQRNKS